MTYFLDGGKEMTALKVREKEGWREGGREGKGGREEGKGGGEEGNGGLYAQTEGQRTFGASTTFIFSRMDARLKIP